MFFKNKKDKKEEKYILTLNRYECDFKVKDGGYFEDETNWIVMNNVDNPSSFIMDCLMKKGYISVGEKSFYPIHNVACVEIHLLEEKRICVLKGNISYRVLTDKKVEEISIDE